MPLDELLALYGYESSDPISEQESEGGDTAPALPDMTLDKEQIAKDLLSGEEEEETQSSADDLTPSVTSHEASDLFHNQSGCRCHWPFLRHGCVSHRHTHMDWAWGLCRDMPW